MVAMGILQVIDGGVFVCICSVYLDIFKKNLSHASVYDIHFSQKDNIKYSVAIIDNRSHSHICVLEEKYKKAKLH